ncbi:MAG: hypothetical protein KDC12_04655 [Flavobacteriales bacterium]|nr:hypothetical protein [Flavobacteriales bacterium]
MSTTKIPVEDRRYMSELHFDHELWVNQLRFFEQELRIFRNRLSEVSIQNTKSEVRAEVEHFQNQFIREKEVIDTLIHDINRHEAVLVQFAKDHPIASDHAYFENHNGLEDRMMMFGKIWFDLKKEFLDFLRKRM